MKLFLLFLLNILFVGAIWHMDVSHNLDRGGVKKTRGVFKISPDAAYRLSQYALILSLILIDLIFIV